MNWEQLKTILWLRWRLTRNQWTRSGGLGPVFAAIVAGAAFFLGGVAFFAGVIGGATAFKEAPPQVISGAWFGVTVVFLFLWFIGLINELQRAESIDLQKLMHLPVALGQMFLINYVASHFAVSLIVLVPAMTGLAIGGAFARGPAMLLLLPLAWSMVFMITAWTYCLRGWLAAMMTNPRRRRAIIMGLTMAIVLLGQLPNLYFNVFQRRERIPQRVGATAEEMQQERERRQAAKDAKMNSLMGLQKYVPPLWLPWGAKGLTEHRVLPALLGTVGCFGLGALGLRRAYRSTVRFYQGESGGKAAAPIQPEKAAVADGKPAKAGSRFMTWRVPGVPEQAMAVALGTFRSMLRAPEVKMAWGTSFAVTLIFGAAVFSRSAPQMPAAAQPFVVTVLMVFSLFMLAQFLANQFGFDREGFRAFVLSPVDRRLILLGKNLATWPVGTFFGLTLLTVVTFWLHLPVTIFLAGIFQIVALLLIGSMGGNVISILVPYRIQAGSMKPTKMPALATLVMVACQMFFPVILAPLFLPGLLEWAWVKAGWPAFVPVNLILSILLAALAAVGYWMLLEPMGRMLHRREMKILNVVTAEQE